MAGSGDKGSELPLQEYLQAAVQVALDAGQVSVQVPRRCSGRVGSSMGQAARL